jgi:hypothetical protein
MKRQQVSHFSEKSFSHPYFSTPSLKTEMTNVLFISDSVVVVGEIIMASVVPEMSLGKRFYSNSMPVYADSIPDSRRFYTCSGV